MFCIKVLGSLSEKNGIMCDFLVKTKNVSEVLK